MPWLPDERTERLASEEIADTYTLLVSQFNRESKRVRRGATTRVEQQAAVP